jgi:hypothetical protein
LPPIVETVDTLTPSAHLVEDTLGVSVAVGLLEVCQEAGTHRPIGTGNQGVDARCARPHAGREPGG